ncbi:TIGR02270 family protein [Teredinibacter turnerae]|uniref:TIGR02270 family protein n=1 Tax=Teredinibacter turnerae TaxID=2426 RepID=UPI00040AEC03|nr:TIGR02270 family protein [Teredinibacter turnerae]
MNPFRKVLEQHVEDAAFLWVLRSAAVDQPHYLTSDIEALEQRLNANLDGIVASLQRSWPLCCEATSFEEGGEAFVLAVTAFRSLEFEKIKFAVDFGVSNPNTFRGLVSALGWLPGSLCHEWVKKFFSSKELVHKYLAIAACSVRRENPGDYLIRILERDDCCAHDLLYCRSLRLIGELKLSQCVSFLEKGLEADSKSVRFWSIWSSILMGRRHLAVLLEDYVMSDNLFRAQALQLAFRTLPLEVAKTWISRLSQDEANLRWVIQATGILGDPHVVPWLLEMSKNPRYARIAGEAFGHITGIDLESHDLSITVPDITEFEADAEPDEINADENLPWPSYEKLSAVWQKYGHSFSVGKRFFMGKALEKCDFRDTIVSGYQRHRRAAALELALANPEQVLVNTSARILAYID